jgi:hypothetical protein
VIFGRDQHQVRDSLAGAATIAANVFSGFVHLALALALALAQAKLVPIQLASASLGPVLACRPALEAHVVFKRQQITCQPVALLPSLSLSFPACRYLFQPNNNEEQIFDHSANLQ